MAANESKAKLKASYNNSLKVATEHMAKHGGTPCDSYILAALGDANVIEHFLEHISNDEFFVGAFCLDGSGTPGEARIIFEFRYLPPKVSILPQRFLVRLNMVTHEVIDVIEPYVPSGSRFGAVAGTSLCR